MERPDDKPPEDKPDLPDGVEIGKPKPQSDSVAPPQGPPPPSPPSPPPPPPPDFNPVGP